ncbi:MAG: phosphotransferase [Proteobacteria bacterium]|nr:phosphotransferase [Pseudomonadota bacterium]
MAMTNGRKKEDELEELAVEYLKTRDFSLKLLKGDGSDRKIYRLESADRQQPDIIGIIHDDLRENRDFFILTRKLKEIGIPVPEIYAIGRTQTAYLIQDLGSYNLAETIEQWKHSAQHGKIIPAYRTVLKFLVKIQRELPPYLKDFLKNRQMGETAYLGDLSYFQNSFLERFGFGSLLTSEVERELTSDLVHHLVELDSRYFVYRDFQSRNIMWLDGSPWFIDYQSAFQGPLFYDLASLLYASKSGLDERAREILLHCYFDSVDCSSGFEEFQQSFYRFVVIRRLRSLGSYSHLSLVKRKEQFFQSIRPTLLELIQLFSHQDALKSFRHLSNMLERIFEIWDGEEEAFFKHHFEKPP